MKRLKSKRDILFIEFGTYTFIQNFRGYISALRYGNAANTDDLLWDKPRFSNKFVLALAEELQETRDALAKLEEELHGKNVYTNAVHTNIKLSFKGE